MQIKYLYSYVNVSQLWLQEITIKSWDNILTVHLIQKEQFINFASVTSVLKTGKNIILAIIF